jgi:uncharacterized protein YndB with AHSA1/START domain
VPAGNWFGVDLDHAAGHFAAGTEVRGQITHPGYEHLVATIWIERVERDRALSWRWRPAAIEPGVDYTAQPTTLVEIALEPLDGGTLWTLVESGSDRLPPSRRDAARTGNAEGWTGQLRRIEAYVA